MVEGVVEGKAETDKVEGVVEGELQLRGLRREWRRLRGYSRS